MLTKYVGLYYNENERGDNMNVNTKPNHDLRLYAMDAGVFMWQIAKAYGVSYNTLNNWMRLEFTEQEKDEFITKVNNIVDKGETV